MREIFLAVLKRLGITKVVVEADGLRFATTENNVHVVFDDIKLSVWLLDVDGSTPIYHEEIPYSTDMTTDALGEFFKQYIMDKIGHIIPTLTDQIVQALKDKNAEVNSIEDNVIDFYWGIYRCFIHVTPTSTIIEDSSRNRQRLVRNYNGLNHIINMIMKFVKEEGQL